MVILLRSEFSVYDALFHVTDSIHCLVLTRHCALYSADMCMAYIIPSILRVLCMARLNIFLFCAGLFVVGLALAFLLFDNDKAGMQLQSFGIVVITFLPNNFSRWVGQKIVSSKNSFGTVRSMLDTSFRVPSKA